MARLTSAAFRKLYTLAKCDQQEVIYQQEPSLEIAPVQLNMQTPILPYKKSVLEEIPKSILHSEDEHAAASSADERAVASSADERIIEPLQEESQNDNLMRESIASENFND